MLLHVCLQGEQAAKGVTDEWIQQENCFAPWRNRFCCGALLLRAAGTVFRKTKICRHYQPHLDFTKPPKLGHLRAHLLENDSLTLYYLSKEFILLLSSPSSSTLLFLISSPFLFFNLSILPPMCPRCCGGAGETERR